MDKTKAQQLKRIKENGQTNLYILFYTLLGIIQALWTNTSAFPPSVLRLIMCLLVFGPLFYRKELVPFVYVFFITLRLHLSTYYSYLPDVFSIGIYILILVVLSIKHIDVWTNFKLGTPGVKVFIASFIFWTLIDLLFIGKIGPGASFFIMAFFLLPFLQDRKTLELTVVGYIIVSVLLSIYYYLMFDKFAVTWNTTEGLERADWSDPNYFSIHLGIGFMMSMACLFGFINIIYVKVHRLFLIFGAFVIFFAIVMTGSRAGVISSALVTLYVIILSKNKLKYKLFPLLILPFILYFVFISQYSQLIIYRLFTEENTNSMGGRTDIWSGILTDYYSQDLGYQLFGGGWWHRAQLAKGSESHNELIAVLCDYGLIGLTLSLLLYIRIILNKYVLAGGARNLLPFVYLMLMMFSLSPSQYPLMPMYISWLIMSFILYKDDVLYKKRIFSEDCNHSLSKNKI